MAQSYSVEPEQVISGPATVPESVEQKVVKLAACVGLYRVVVWACLASRSGDLSERWTGRAEHEAADAVYDAHASPRSNAVGYVLL